MKSGIVLEFGGEAGVSFVDWDDDVAFFVRQLEISFGLGIRIGLGPEFIRLLCKLVRGSAACLLGVTTGPALSWEFA